MNVHVWRLSSGAAVDYFCPISDILLQSLLLFLFPSVLKQNKYSLPWHSAVCLLSYKTCLCFAENKNHFCCLSKVSFWLLWFDSIINFGIVFGSMVSVVTCSCLKFMVSVAGCFSLLLFCDWLKRNWTCGTHHFLSTPGLPVKVLIRITFVSQLSCHKVFKLSLQLYTVQVTSIQ